MCLFYSIQLIMHFLKESNENNQVFPLDFVLNLKTKLSTKLKKLNRIHIYICLDKFVLKCHYLT